MENKEIRLINLRELLKEVRSASALAYAAGTSPAYISQILSKKTKGSIGNRLARKLEQATNRPRGWLDQLHEGHAGAALSLLSIPILQSEKMLAAHCPKRYIQTELVNQASVNGRSKHEKLFCMEIIGDAMTSVTDIATSICHGDLAIIDENQGHNSGDIILFEKEKAIKIRQVVQDGNEQILKPFNQQYPVIPFSEDVKVLGVVVELRRKLKAVNTAV